ncbi:hypothetical protein [Streptomyces olivaceiscleroticus]|uniref:Uncharacterized protein n=1 Tax=Streptomyces olivaceiscleroticus TaxID=68245 RepID=A0ABN1BPC1_9ACTN
MSNATGAPEYAAISQRAINGAHRPSFFPAVPKSALARVPHSLRTRKTPVVRIDEAPAGWRGTVSGRLTAQERQTGGYRLLVLTTSEGRDFWAILSPAQSAAHLWLPGSKVTFLGRKRLPDPARPHNPTTFDVLDVVAVTR